MKKKLLSLLLAAAILSTSALSMLVGVSAAEADGTNATQRLDGEGFDLLEGNESYTTLKSIFRGGYTAGDPNDLQVDAAGNTKAQYEIDTTTSALRGDGTEEGSYRSLKITPYDSGAGYGFFRWGDGVIDPNTYMNGLDAALAEGKYDEIEMYLVFYAKADADDLNLNVALDVKNTAFPMDVTLTTEWQEYKINVKDMRLNDDAKYGNRNFMEIYVAGLEDASMKWDVGLHESYFSRIKFGFNALGHSFWLDEIGFEYSGFEIADSDKDQGDLDEAGTVPDGFEGDNTSSDEASSEDPVVSSEDTSSEDPVVSSEDTSSEEQDTSSEDTASKEQRPNEEIAADLAQDLYSIEGDRWMIDNFNDYTQDTMYSAYHDWFWVNGKDKSLYGGVQIINDKTAYYGDVNTGDKDAVKKQQNISNIKSTLTADGKLEMSWITNERNDTWTQNSGNYPCLRWRPNNYFVGADGGATSLIGDGWAVDVTNTSGEEIRITAKIHVDGKSTVHSFETVIPVGTSVLKFPYASFLYGGQTGMTMTAEEVKEDMTSSLNKRGESLVLSIGFFEDSSFPTSGTLTFDNTRFFTEDSAYTTQVSNALKAATVSEEDLATKDPEQVALYKAAMAQVDAEYAALGGAATPAQYKLIAQKYAYAAEYIGLDVEVGDVTPSNPSNSGNGSNNNSSTSPKTGVASDIALAGLFLIAAGCTAVLLGKKKRAR